MKLGRLEAGASVRFRFGNQRWNYPRISISWRHTHTDFAIGFTHKEAFICKCAFIEVLSRHQSGEKQVYLPVDVP